MREIDQLTTERYGIPSLTLMENAAIATARIVSQQLNGNVSGERVLVLCGRGNNGGDGAAMARLLALAGANVDVIILGQVEDAKGDARINFERLNSWRDEHAIDDEMLAASLGTINLYECDSEKGWFQLVASILNVRPKIIVDAIFGTGLTRPVAGVHREVVRYLNDLRATRDSRVKANSPIVSIDIPSGLNSNSFEPIGESVQADVTVTMTAPKLANVLPPAADLNGQLMVADIGSPEELISAAGSRLFLIEADDARSWLVRTRYTPDSYKNTHGHALVIAGSRGFTGAAALCGNAAMRAGAGLVTVATPASAQPLVATQVMPEVMTTALAETDRGAVSDDAVDYVLKFAARAEVIAIGPGLSAEDERTRDFVHAVVERRRTPVVIDADGLNCLSPWPDDLSGSSRHPIVLTPHPGEMLRLMGETDKSALRDRVAASSEFARAHQTILVLKGSRALIAAPDGRVFINPTGNAGLGTAGSGDTLTGIIAGFLAQEHGAMKNDAAALQAVIAAIYIGGLAGDIAARTLGMRAMVASDIRDHLSAAICALDPDGERPSIAGEHD
jgi:ADP-dependent NAD(P)H-hydrate dehydratase / NAD(P)H-hydrate epimerase